MSNNKPMQNKSKAPTYYYFSSNFIQFFMRYTMLHNSEFKQGRDFLNMLTTYDDNTAKTFNVFNIIYKNNGLFLFADDENELSGVVLDLDNIKDKPLYQKNVLLIIERYFRIYIKITQHLPLGYNELPIGDNKYIIAPFPYSNNDFIKYIITSAPEPSRDSVRNIHLFLNIADGSGQLDSSKFSHVNYHKVKEIFADVKKFAKEKDNNNEISLLSNIVDFSKEKTLTPVLNYIGYDKWEAYLTQKQRDIVFSESMGPIKIVGPAGSGKTLTIVLKALYMAKKFKQENRELRIGFVCHSVSMKQTIETMLNIDGSSFFDSSSAVHISVETLLDWCCSNAVMALTPADCMEVDSADLKIAQDMYIDNAVESFLANEYSTFKPYLSEELIVFFENTQPERRVELLRNEFSIYIKGPGIDTADEYVNGLKNKRIIPVQKEEDMRAVFRIFRIYQDNIAATGKFDLDDVTSTALRFLSGPIWKIRRQSAGYDVLFVDELHLYDFSEIAIFKYMLRNSTNNNIVSTVDISQSTGDLDMIESNIKALFEGDKYREDSLNVVFRSSQSIVNLASLLFEHKIILFGKDNPLTFVNVVHDEDDCVPELNEYLDDVTMIENIASEHIFKTHEKADTLIVYTDIALENKLKEAFERKNISISFLRCRSDYTTVRSANKDGKLVLGYIDFIGGLEFKNVYLVGLDVDRVPPVDNTMSYAFFEHIWYRKLYVAMTRTRHKLVICSNIANGQHSFLTFAVGRKLLNKRPRQN